MRDSLETEARPASAFSTACPCRLGLLPKISTFLNMRWPMPWLGNVGLDCLPTIPFSAEQNREG
jgi:hypothetical protein